MGCGCSGPCSCSNYTDTWGKIPEITVDCKMPGMTKMLYDLKCDTCGRKDSGHYEMLCNRFKGDCPGTLKFLARVSGLERIDRLCDSLEQSDWRPVAETLPNVEETGKSRDVLGCWENDDMLTVFYYPGSGVEWVLSDSGEACLTVPSHWMPLPEPPKRQE